jgi:oligopeptidase B
VTARDGACTGLGRDEKGVELNGKAPLLLCLWQLRYFDGTIVLAGQTQSAGSRRDLCAAHIRGGTEMGEHWHDDGMLMKKKNTFYDFIDVAEYLTKNGWTSRDRLIIEGGSAGGLLMVPVTNMRPDSAQSRPRRRTVCGRNEHHDGRQPAADHR